VCASFRVEIYLFDLWAKRLIFWKFCLATTSYKDRIFYFFLICAQKIFFRFFLIVKPKERESRERKDSLIAHVSFFSFRLRRPRLQLYILPHQNDLKLGFASNQSPEHSCYTCNIEQSLSFEIITLTYFFTTIPVTNIDNSRVSEKTLQISSRTQVFFRHFSIHLEDFYHFM